MKRSYWKLVLIMMMAIPTLLACGGDSDSDNPNIVDGVRVTNGRKLMKFRVSGRQNKYLDFRHAFALSYDTQNRINSISQIYYKDDGSIHSEKEVIQIDYERKLLFNNISHKDKKIYNFMTSEKGLVTKIGPYYLSYDETGNLSSLIGEDVFSLMYVNNQLTGYMNIWKDIQKNYNIYDYSDYGDADFNFAVSLNEDQIKEFDSYDCLLVVAIQSGLFGNIPEIFRLMSQRNKSTVHIDLPNSILKEGITCEFYYE